jgi:cell division protein FtsZ
LFNISGGNDLSLYEINEAARTITETANPEAKIIFGTSKDNDLKEGELKIIVIAGGFEEKEIEEDGLFDRVENELFSTPSEKKKIEISQEDDDVTENKEEETEPEDELDIPAFLRKKRN